MSVNTPVRPEPSAPPQLSIRAADAPVVTSEEEAPPVFELRSFDAFYGSFQAIRGITMDVAPNKITALIGPSGSGKSTILRWLNRMNDLIPGATMGGEVLYHGVNLFDKRVDPVEVRRRIGMVFQKPNPFPKSIYENVAFGPRVAGFTGKMDDLVEESLRR
ncbi:MAG TPA: ATP-binding cassette domain-containing protein, partial [Candidatus Limnocylindrales bacterium]|nr:ATP-binding cassette domain-containing protein [Candidatus Limnocylindrales bacterium]